MYFHQILHEKFYSTIKEELLIEFHAIAKAKISIFCITFVKFSIKKNVKAKCLMFVENITTVLISGINRNIQRWVKL